ncbi:Calx-beta domain-containing protein [Planktothrix mougeotii]|nr:Calx-beta domain-containing protein [Planktothrix mougeotii]
MTQLIGTASNDLLTGTPEPDEILGFTGNDTLQGLAENDSLNGGQDADLLSGGIGNDLLFGDIGNDTLEGDSGDDLIYGNAGDDQLNGGEGADLLFGGQGSDTLFDSGGNDLLFGDRGNDLLYSGTGVNELTGGGGSDVFVIGRELLDGQLDIVTDFRIGVDLIGLTNNLKFSDLRFVQVGNDTVIEDKLSNQQLILVQEIEATVLNNQANFTQSIESSTPIIEFTNTTPLQVQEGETSALFVNVQRAGSLLNTVSATLGLKTDTATSSDVSLEVVEVVFQPYETFKVVSVPINIVDDQQPEPNESFQLTLSNPKGGATLGESEEIAVTLQDNDVSLSPSPLPTTSSLFIPLPPSPSTISVSLSPDIVAEDSEVPLVYTFTREGGSLNLPITVNFNVGGTAKLGENYTVTNEGTFTSTQGSVSFPANVTTATVTIVPINDDKFEEVGKTVDLTLVESGFLYVTNPQESTALGTITSEDPPPMPPVYNFSQAEYSVFEGDPDIPQKASITINRSFDTDLVSSVKILLTPALQNGGTPGVDVEPTEISLVFAEAETQKTFSIPVIGDNTIEPSEVIVLSFDPDNFQPSGQPGTINPQATLNINDDDGPTTYDFASKFFQTLEGNSTNVTQVVEINRSGDINVDSSVNVNLTGVNAVPNVDFAPGPITVNFKAGEITQTVPITITGDLGSDQNKTINLSLSAPPGSLVGNLHPTADLLVIDDDNVPTYDFTTNVYEVRENNADITYSEITVIRSGKVDIASSVTVNLNTGSPNGATPEEDYSPSEIGLQFLPGETSKTLQITIKGDEVSESSEAIALSFSNFDNEGQPGTTAPEAILTIADDDSPPTYNFVQNNYEVEEGDASSQFNQVEVARSGDISQQSSVDVVLTSVTAISDTDFKPGPIRLTFAPNQDKQTVPIEIIGNVRVQPDRTLQLSFANFDQNGQAGNDNPTTVVTIDDDDQATLSLTTVEAIATEPTTTKVENELPKNGVYRISRAPDTFGDLTVNLALTPDKISEDDYTLTTSTGQTVTINNDSTAVVTLPNDQVSLDIILTPIDDIPAEADESLTLALAEGDYKISPKENTATVTIQANDTAVTQLGDGQKSQTPEDYALVEGSLRQAILNAQSLTGEDTITFADQASSGVINLTGALPALNSDIIFDGPGADQLSVRRDTGGDYNIFNINGGNITIEGLKLTNGFPAGTIPSTSSTTTGSRGGAINITSSTSNVQVIDSWLDGNRANNGGAIANSGKLTIQNSTISNNQGSNGGGVIVIDGQVQIINSTIANNIANIGGGVFNSVAELTITNSTIGFNQATGNSGGVRNIGGVSNLKNTLIASNTAPFNPDVGASIEFAFNSGGNNLIGDGTGGEGLINGVDNDIVGSSTTPIDPLLSPLQNNGGTTPTLALASTSLAINAGNNSFAIPHTNPGQFDQRGPNFTRIVNNIIDIGAFESQLI